MKYAFEPEIPDSDVPVFMAAVRQVDATAQAWAVGSPLDNTYRMKTTLSLDELKAISKTCPDGGHYITGSLRVVPEGR